MKRNAFNVIVSILLILASLLALGGAGWGGVECYALDAMRDKLDETKEPFTKLEEAIHALQDNEDKYISGIDVCYEGDVKIVQGNQMIVNGKAELQDKEAQLKQAQSEYDKAAAQLAQGKAQLAEARAKMDASRPDYEEGKAQLAKLEQLQPTLHRYLEIRSSVLEGNAAFSVLDFFFDTVVVPACASLGLTLPTDPYAFSEYMDAQIAQGKAMLAEYEAAEAKLDDAQAQIDDAEAKLVEAKSKLDQGYSLIDEGYSKINVAEGQLSAAAGKVAEGKATLGEYEEAIGKVEEAILKCLEMEPVHKRDGSDALKSIAARMGDGFDIYLHNEEGAVLSLQNGNPRLDYDKCLQVCSAYYDYVDDYQSALAHEALLRFILACGMALAGLFGIVSAIVALRGKAASAKLGTLLFVFLVGLNVYGIAIGYASYTFPEGEAKFQGLLPLLTLLIFTFVSLLFMIAVRAGRRKARKLIKAADEAPSPAHEKEPVTVATAVSPAACEPAPEPVTAPEPTPIVTPKTAAQPKPDSRSHLKDYDSAHAEYEKSLQSLRDLVNR